MLRIAFCFVSLLLSGPASTQQPEGSPQTARTVYFLVDVSGSMKTRIEDAETELAKLRSEIYAQDRNTAFSRTEFRAATLSDCDDSPSIQPARPLLDWSPPATQRRFSTNDFTPLGSFLKAAILDAEKGPADIYVASDWAQSPNCGVDVETALDAVPYDADISIHPIAVRPTDADLSIAQAASIRSSTLLIGKSTGTTNGSPDDEDEKIFSWAMLVHFLEVWTWLIGFAALAGSAVWFGLRDSSWSVEIEGRTDEAKSHKQLIRDGDIPAQSELEKLVREKKEIDVRFSKAAFHWRRSRSRPLENEKPQDNQKPSDNDKPHDARKSAKIGEVDTSARKRRLLTKPFFWLGAFGALVLLSLALVDARLSISEYDLRDAKLHAVSVLDSDFATAFAGTWLILMYFASQQGQRKREADRNFDIATDEAGRAAKEAIEAALLEKSEAHELAFSDYLTSYTTVSNFNFPMPWDEAAITPENEEHFSLIASFAYTASLGKKLQLSDSVEELTKEKRRLDSLPSPPRGRWGTRSSFGRFLEALVDDGSIELNADAWRALGRTFSKRTSLEKIRALDEFFERYHGSLTS